MRVLLDENLPHGLRLELPGHDVVTVSYAGLKGVANGELLRRAAAAGFDVLVTNDRNLEHQQNLATLPLAVVVIHAPADTLPAIRPTIPNLLAALATLPACGFARVSAP